MSNNAKATLSIQWHITSKCGKRCRHCYMYESERYITEIENQLSFPDMLRILDDIADFEDKWGFEVNNFFITGGDPILNPDYIPLLKELHHRRKNIYIMGNPETLTADILDFFVEMGVRQVQLSLDGLRDTHDFYRGTGNFDTTIKALELLDTYDIPGTVMFTLTGENKEQMIPLIRYLASETKTKGFAFDLVCGVGNAKNIAIELTKEDVYQCLSSYLHEKQRLRQKKCAMRLAEKSKFFQLLHYDQDDFYPYATNDFSVIGGCYIGFTCYTILADGSVAACRRFPTIVGKMPEQKMEDIFLGSPLLKKFRRPSSYQACGECSFFKSCRGCPAVTFGYTKDPFSKNPLCFKEMLHKKTPRAHWSSPPMSVSKAEEATIIKSMLRNQYATEYEEFITKDDVILLIGTLLGDKMERKQFLKNPDEYVKINGILLSQKDIAYICYYLNCVQQNRIPNPIKYALDF